MTLNAIPLHRLVQSRSNARRTGRKAGLNELISSIRSQGLRQNLNVRPITGGRFEVVAGGRRLRALKQLARAGTLPTDHPVPCLLLSPEDQAVEVSLAENAVRESMHPDDQCTAFAALVEAGSSLDDVAARFGITAAVVRHRLKLASVASSLRTLFRHGDLSLDQMMAFALVDDHAAQEAAWAELPAWNNGPDAIRRVLTRSTVPATHRLARFVGLKTYEGAGGPVIRDLFGSPDQCFLADGHLLERLATEQLTRIADDVRAEGWSWVSIEPDLDWSIRYNQVHPEREADAGQPFSAEGRARAGARLSLNPDGSIRIDRGLVRPEPAKAARGKRPQDDRTSTTGRLSARLVEELTGHRTAALRVELANHPDLALAATVHALTLAVIYPPDFDAISCLALNATTEQLEGHVGESQEGLAHHPFADLDATWRARLPRKPAELWTWCLGQDQATLLDLLAFVAALTVNAVVLRRDRPGNPRLAHADRLATALDLDMRSWWRPAPEGFGQSISKAGLAAPLAEVGQDGLANRVQAAKKLDAARITVPALVEAGWLPAPLNVSIPVSHDRSTADANSSER